MKSLKVFFFSFLLVVFAQAAFAQKTKSETLTVSGVCGMCKKKIETAAKSAGASFASWSPDSKQLVVKYNPANVSSAKIQQSVAAAGYDTPEVKATEAAYENLHECCKYERAAVAENAACCASATCSKTDDCCKGAACCNGESCAVHTEAAACCKKEAAQGQQMDCCKGGKCTKHTAPKKG